MGPNTYALQKQAITAAGIGVEAFRIVAETISGSVAAMDRQGFARLVDRLESGHMLVVTKMDRLGRRAMDVMATIEHLATLSVRVKCLALGDATLTSAAGRMTTGILNVVAQFERDLLVERTRAGLARARAQGKRLSRPPSLEVERQAEVAAALRNGEAIAALARRFRTSRQTIQRIRDHRVAAGTPAKEP